MSKGIAYSGLLDVSDKISEKINFDAIKVTIASPEDILSWSWGEVTKPETINYRTFKPERDGLFCAKIFGPVKDYQCLCGKYKRAKYKGIICEKCGVEITSSKVRRERMGHVNLVAPVAHIWFVKSLPSRVSTLLGVTLRNLERVIYFESYFVIDPKMSKYNIGDVLSEDEYQKYIEENGISSVEVGMGAEAVKKILQNINLEKLRAKLLDMKMKAGGSKAKSDKINKRLKLVNDFIKSNNRPEWMILDVLPVIPPDIRPLVMLDGNRFAASDLNDLYRKVINRNNRLKRLLELKAPEIMIRNEKRMLQEAVDALFDNTRSGNVARSNNRRALKSLADMLKGKQGRFRQNLLGKRVDYSGRSVIVVGPHLKLHQCGLPKKMALELFKPFIYAKLELYGLSNSISISKKKVEAQDHDVLDILDDIIKEHPVILNRAPTLHRLGMQAFEPILTEGKAIELHPLVCTAFNADFDGDQMAVHVPLSIEAQMEARVLMMSTNNILSPQNGKPIIVPSQDVILGLYYMTAAKIDDDSAGRLIASYHELNLALDNEIVSLHDKISYRYKYYTSDGIERFDIAQTSVGRAMVYETLPESAKRDFSVINLPITKKVITNLIDYIYRSSSAKDTVIFCDRIMQLGFKMCFKSGVSVSKDDMVIPQKKQELIDFYQGKVDEINGQYQEGFVTLGERYNKIIDEWSSCTDEVAKEMMKKISEYTSPMNMNSIFMMADSGARGSETQIRQLAGMRGLMTKSSGEIIEHPIRSNFKEGLNLGEYLNSSYGARKGLSDTALKTANSGYLTRRLVDVAQDCVVLLEDCGTKEYITVESIVEHGNIAVSVGEQVLGRSAAEDIFDPSSKALIIKKNEIIDERAVELIEKVGFESIKIRSVITCDVIGGTCKKCYGRDLATGLPVNTGESVGIIAAQSIGEPGTQLTMRTFHIGGAALRDSSQSSILAPQKGFIHYDTKSAIVNRYGKNVVITPNCEVKLLNSDKETINSYRIPYGSIIHLDVNQVIAKGDVIADWDKYNIPIISQHSGYIYYEDLIEGVSLLEKLDDDTGVSVKIIIDWKRGAKREFKPRIIIYDSKDKQNVTGEYVLPVGATLNVSSGDSIKIGDILAKIPKESSKSKDITGGLPKIAELFEARMPKDPAIMSHIDGKVIINKGYKSRRKITIEAINGGNSVEYVIPKDKHLFVDDGDIVKKGDILIDGDLVLHDILQILGIEVFTKYITNEIQKIYRMQGVKIDNKHIEVILKNMLKKVEIVEIGDSDFIIGDIVDKDVFIRENENLQKTGKREARSKPCLLGITKSSLQTKSFISAASFQETTKILTDASIRGKVDILKGLKESVIVGKLIPAGTGLIASRVKKIASGES